MTMVLVVVIMVMAMAMVVMNKRPKIQTEAKKQNTSEIFKEMVQVGQWDKKKVRLPQNIMALVGPKEVDLGG